MVSGRQPDAVSLPPEGGGDREIPSVSSRAQEEVEEAQEAQEAQPGDCQVVIRNTGRSRSSVERCCHPTAPRAASSTASRRTDARLMVASRLLQNKSPCSQATAE